MSSNRIAKDAGATLGAVKNQFGGIDGLWAAVLRRTAERRGQLDPALFAHALINRSDATPDAPDGVASRRRRTESALPADRG